MAKSVSICGKKNASKALFTIYLYLTQIVHTDMFRFVVSGSYDRHDGLRVIIVDSATNAKNKQSNKHAWG